MISDLRRAFDPHADPRNVAMIRRRHGFWAELSRLHGWDLAVCDAADVDAPERRRSVCWIDLPMLTRASYRAAFSRATAAGAACVLQHPDEVERVLGLDRSYPVLMHGDPVILELNPLYAAGYNVPAAHALIVAALGADLARRAGYAELSWTEVLQTAGELAGEPIEQSPAVWLFR